MATTAATIADLWKPDIWVRGKDELIRIHPSFLTSGAMMRSPLFDEIASGGGERVNLPMFRDITDIPDGIQAEGVVAGTAVNKITAGTNVAPMLNREVCFGVTGLAVAVSGDKPVDAVLTQLAVRGQKQRQLPALSILRGLFSSGGAAGQTTAALYSQLNDHFVEAPTSTPVAPNLITTSYVNATIALMGETSSSLQNGAILVHPMIHAALKTIDAASFSTIPSVLGLRIPTYQGIPLYESALLSRAAGTPPGFVFETYFVGPGAIAWGEKPQLGQAIDAASLSLYSRYDINEMQIYDRSRFFIHVNGTKFGGTIAGQSATNAELATVGSWQYIGTAPTITGAGLGIPIACLRTNG